MANVFPELQIFSTGPTTRRRIRTYSLLTVALCAASALRAADVCGGLPLDVSSPFSKWDGDPGKPGPIAFRLSVRHDGPAFRVTIRRFPFEFDGREVHAADIEVDRCRDGSRVQVLPVMAPQPFDFPPLTVDVNFDGYLDFAVVADHGAKWGRYIWWVYDPNAGRFVQDNLTHQLGRLAANDFRFDVKKHEIITEDLIAGCPPLVTRYRVAANRLVTVHEEIGAQNIDNGCTVTYQDRVNGIMRTSHVQRFVRGRPLK